MDRIKEEDEEVYKDQSPDFDQANIIDLYNKMHDNTLSNTTSDDLNDQEIDLNILLRTSEEQNFVSVEKLSSKSASNSSLNSITSSSKISLIKFLLGFCICTDYLKSVETRLTSSLATKLESIINNSSAVDSNHKKKKQDLSHENLNNHLTDKVKIENRSNFDDKLNIDDNNNNTSQIENNLNEMDEENNLNSVKKKSRTWSFYIRKHNEQIQQNEFKEKMKERTQSQKCPLVNSGLRLQESLTTPDNLNIPNRDQDAENEDDIDINELMPRFIENMRRQQQEIKKSMLNDNEDFSNEIFLKKISKHKNSSNLDVDKKDTKNRTKENTFKSDDDNENEEKMSQLNKTKNLKEKCEPKKNLTLNDYFEQKVFLDMMKKSKTKSKTFHSDLLARGLNSGMSRGKMVKLSDYNAANSDDDTSDASDRFESSLFYRYGMASRFVDSSPRALSLPKWSVKRKDNFPSIYSTASSKLDTYKNKHSNSKIIDNNQNGSNNKDAKTELNNG